MYRSILVPLDGSEFSEQALPIAANIGKRSGSKLHIVRAHSPIAALSRESDFVVDMELDEKTRLVETLYLAGVAKQVKEAVDIEVTPTLVKSFGAEALREQAIRDDADLVVMATHGRGGFSRFWLGSMADALIRTLPMPVLLVRPQEMALSLSDTFAPRHILIPLDGSVRAEGILEPAIELGELFAAEFTLLRVVEPFMSPLEFANQGLNDEFERRNLAYLEGIAAKFHDRSLHVKTRVVLNRPAAIAILEQARTLNADLIALETHGRGGLGRLLLGSVADKVIRGAQIPVLVHRPLPQMA
jgi:nucleotide-binding universal stress UspA family protein